MNELVQMILLKQGELAGAPAEFQLLPLGWVEFDGGRFRVDEAGIDRVIRNWRERGVDLVFDYEHQTLQDVQAPASGWIRELLKRPDGLWVRVEWTERAREYLKNREYRYYSPVPLLDPATGELTALHSVALTNAPRTHHLAPLVAKREEKINSPKEGTMDKEILQALGLTEGADTAAAVAAIEALKQNQARETIPDRLKEALSLKKDAGESEVVAAVLALKQTATAVPLEEFRALQLQLKRRDAAEAMEKAAAAGKISPAQREWAQHYAETDPAGFAAFVEKAPAVVPLKHLPAAGSSGDAGGLTESDRLVAAQMGTSLEALKKYGGE